MLNVLSRVVQRGAKRSQRIDALPAQMGSGAEREGVVEGAGQTSSCGSHVGAHLLPVLFRCSCLASCTDFRLCDSPDEAVPVGPNFAVCGDSQRKQVVTCVAGKVPIYFLRFAVAAFSTADRAEG